MKKIFLFAIVVLTVGSCGVFNEKNKGKGFNLFTVEDDKLLGAQVDSAIRADTLQFPILDSIRYAEVYDYIYKVRNKILKTDKIDFREEFGWKITVINNDSTLNAFCTPGGYIYIYTGILKFLDSEDEFAGVLAHEMAHADMRHSTRQMTTMFGVQILLEVIAGDRDALKQVTGALVGLKFSRKHETEADEKSVEYLCPTDYNAAGGAEFFIKLREVNSSNPPEFLSTHPDPEDRIEKFLNNAIIMGCTGTKTYETEYKLMLSKLP